MSKAPEMVRLAARELEVLASALEEPAEAQDRVLEGLLRIYAKTGLGREHGLEEGMDLEEYRSALPPRRYDAFRPYVVRVLRGHVEVLLAEEPVFFGITSGTTGQPKLIPITSTDAELRARVMAACLAWLTARWGLEGVLGSPCLAPCLPSRVSTVRLRGREVPCGYISGINAEIMARYLGLEEALRPYLDEVNAIGPGISRADWEKRFQAALRAVEGHDMKVAVGAGPALWMFARWLKRVKGAWPRELWNMELLLIAGVPHIQAAYVPELTRYYGQDALPVELYGATEGLFAATLAEEPYLVPFYHAYLFEARVGKCVKMLHEMKAGELGSLIVSTPVLPRYEIGDLVVCHADGLYFSVPGRDRLAVRLSAKITAFVSALASLL